MKFFSNCMLGLWNLFSAGSTIFFIILVVCAPAALAILGIQILLTIILAIGWIASAIITLVWKIVSFPFKLIYKIIVK